MGVFAFVGGRYPQITRGPFPGLGQSPLPNNRREGLTCVLKCCVHGEGKRYAAKAAGALLTKRAHHRHLIDTRGESVHSPIVHDPYEIFSRCAVCHIVFGAPTKIE